MIRLELQGAQVSIAHGRTEDNQQLAIMQFTDPNSGIMVLVPLAGGSIQEVINALSVQGIQVAKQMPGGGAGGGLLGV